MNLDSTPDQARIERELREFVAREVEPEAEQFDREGALPLELFETVARQGYWRAGISREYGGNDTSAPEHDPGRAKDCPMRPGK